MNSIGAYSFRFFHALQDIPRHEWDQVVGWNNKLLSYNYIEALYTSCPPNMRCCVVGYYNNEVLVGGALLQSISLRDTNLFGDSSLKGMIQKTMVQMIAPSILIVGNNTLSGNHAFQFDASQISVADQMKLIQASMVSYEKETNRSSIHIWKDFQIMDAEKMQATDLFREYYPLTVQPSMQVDLSHKKWTSYEEYLKALSTKYRTRANTARKKITPAVLVELTTENIQLHQREMYQLYLNVSKNANFNTFILGEDHFSVLKATLQEDFRCFGYFEGDRLIGFFSMILNKKEVDTYFLGYDIHLQKEKQIYLNMLLDMLKWAIEHGYDRINFGRTALEIKSTIGAEPIPMVLFLKHKSGWINRLLRYYFTSVYQSEKWIQRSPYREK